MKKIVIETLPVSTNRLYVVGPNGRRVLSTKGRFNKEAVAWEAKAAYDGEPKKGELRVQIDLFFPNRIRRDVDNIKGFLDALSGILWEDDSQIVELRILKHLDLKKPRVEITFL